MNNTTTQEAVSTPEAEQMIAAALQKIEQAATHQPTQSSALSLGSTEPVQGSNTGFYVSPEEYALIQLAKEDRINNGLDAKAKRHSKIMPSRRITVALRRTDLKKVAPDHDVVAYIEVCNLKAVAGQKSEASDEEMAAYLQLFRQGAEPTLAAIEAIAGKAA